MNWYLMAQSISRAMAPRAEQPFREPVPRLVVHDQIRHVGGAEQAAARLLFGEDRTVGVPEPEGTRVHQAKTRRAAPRQLPGKQAPPSVMEEIKTFTTGGGYSGSPAARSN
jgi:hypothetical protein